MSKKRKSKEKESVADLIARAKTNTVKVSVYNLKTKPYRPPSPKKISSSMSVISYEDDVSMSGYSIHSFDSGLSVSPSADK